MMWRRNRRRSVLAVLARISLRHDHYTWTIPCRDAWGKRAQLNVGLAPDGMTLAITRQGPITLTPLQAGRLRAAVREAIHAHAPLATPGPRTRHHNTTAPVFGAYFEFAPNETTVPSNAVNQPSDDEQENGHEVRTPESSETLAERSRQHQAA